MKKILVLLLLLIPSYLWAACSWTGNVGTPDTDNSAAHIAECTTTATTNQSGGVAIINLNAGNTSWSGNLTINMTSGYTNVTDLRIIGAGTYADHGASASGGTTITITGHYINVTVAPQKKIRISNITFTGTPGSLVGDSACIFINGATKYSNGGGFRVDHNTYVGNIRTMYLYTSIAYGLIDANIQNGDEQVIGWGAGSNSNAAGDGDGNASWGTDDTIGLAGAGDAVYLENNQFTAGVDTCSGNHCWMVMDTSCGGRVVERYNDVTNHYLGGHDATQCRAQRHFEYYNNDLYAKEANSNGTISMRGGTGLVYNNYIHSDQANSSAAFQSNLGNAGIPLMDYRWDSVAGEGDLGGVFANTCTAGHQTKGYLGPTVTETGGTCTSGTGCVYMDNTTGEGTTLNEGWPCLDQIGRGKDQVSQPTLLWNNIVKFANNAPVPAVAYVRNGNITKDLDYCETSSATMPAKCPADTGVVSKDYTPFTCPHPWTGLTGSCDTTSTSMYGTAGYNIENAPTATAVCQGCVLSGGLMR